MIMYWSDFRQLFINHQNNVNMFLTFHAVGFFLFLDFVWATNDLKLECSTDEISMLLKSGERGGRGHSAHLKGKAIIKDLAAH